MKTLSAIIFTTVTLIGSIGYSYSSFLPQQNDPTQKNLEFICIQKKYFKWYLEVDINDGKAISYELYREPQNLLYQDHAKVSDESVYEFKSEDSSENNREAYLLYFNLEQKKATIVRLHNSGENGVESFNFDCYHDDRDLLLFQ